MRRHKRRQLHVQWSPGTIAKRHKAALCACKSTVSWQAEHQKSKFLNYHIYKYYIIYITIGLHDCTFQWPTTASGSRPLLLPRKNRRPRVPIIPEEVAISSFAKLIGSLSLGLKTAEFNKMILQFFQPTIRVIISSAVQRWWRAQMWSAGLNLKKPLQRTWITSSRAKTTMRCHLFPNLPRRQHQRGK